MNLKNIFKITKQMGLPWVAFRGTYEVKRKTGLLRRQFPATVLSDVDFISEICAPNISSKEELGELVKKQGDKYFFQVKSLPSFKKQLNEFLTEEEKKRIIQIADNAIQGKIHCFSRWTADYGTPINWHLNPVNGYEWPKNIHWVELEELANE